MRTTHIPDFTCAGCDETLDEAWYLDVDTGACVCEYCLREWCAETMANMRQGEIASMFGMERCEREE